MTMLAQNLDITAADPFEGKISVKGKQWQSSYWDEGRVEKLVSGHAIPEMIARLLVQRDIDLGDIDEFLSPTLSKHFPNPFSLQNMEATSDFLANAIQSGQKIGILADFDVDGATSCAVMKRFLQQAGIPENDIPVFIPDRLNDGYGPSSKGFQSLKDQGADIVTVLDCGITSVDPVQSAIDIGLDVVVVDHHEPDEQLPNATHIINPKLKGDNSGLDYLAAVGVTFLLCVAVNSKLREVGHYNDKTEPVMRELLDLVALGTVCDMVPLVKANRLFVKQGFPMMAQGRCKGLNALLHVSNITTMPDPYHAGFMLGPRINAGSRVHQSDLGAQLLSTSDEAEATRIAWLLDDCNKKRQEIQKDMTREAAAKAKAMMIENPSFHSLVIDGEGWHSGLSGLVAGNLKDKHEKPTCVIAYVETDDGRIEGRASGRSVPGVPIANIFMLAQKQGIIVKGGGHAMAGGFTIEKDKIDEFRTFFDQQVQLYERNAPSNQIETVDLCLAVRSLGIKTAEHLTQSLAPYGMANAEPVTVLSNVVIDYADQVGVNHLRCTIKDAEGSVGMKAMAFKAFDNDLGKTLRECAKTGQLIHLRGQVKVNEWQGRRSVEFHINDAMVA
jgi:single-stranded-DNA-specific exonuclease